MSLPRAVAAWWTRRSERQRLVGLFLFALLLRLTYLAQIQDSIFFDTLLGDGQTYDAWAQQIGRDFWGKQAFFQAPLYPYFLAASYGLFGHDLLVVRVIQALLGSCACVLLARATQSFFSRSIGYWSGLVLAVYGPALFFDGIVQKASLDLFLTTALLCSLALYRERGEHRFAALSGITLGCLALTREQALIWAPCLLAWFALAKPRTVLATTLARRVFPFALGLTLVLAPVALRNYAVSGELLLTTSQFGQNLYIGNNAEADGTYKSLRFGHGGAELERSDAVELAEGATGRKLGSAEVSRYWAGRAWDFITGQPGQWLRLLARKALLVCNARELPDSDEPLVYADESWLLGALSRFFSWGTLFPLALAGAFSTRARRPRLLLLHVLSVTLAAATALFFVFARYRYPLVPILVPFAVLALGEAARLLWTKQFSEALRLGSLVVVGAVVAGLELTAREQPRATAYYDLAVSLERLGRPNDARASYQRALSANAGFIEAHVNLGALLARTGQLDEAASHEQAALRLDPNAVLAHVNLGNIFFERHQLVEAAEHYRQALLLEPTQLQARAGLAAVQEQIRAQQLDLRAR